METEIPAWLDKNFLISSLQEEVGLKSKVTIESFSVSMAVPLGNNFTSHLYRVKVEYRVDSLTVQKTSLIIKAPLTTGAVSAMSEKVDLMSTEPKVYKYLIPKMYKKSKHEFAAKTYSCCGLKNGLVLQDLKEDGYTLSDRLKQLDFSHCKIAVSTLAKFHAASVAVYKDDPDFVKMIGTERIYKKDGGLMQEFKPWIVSCTNIIAGKVLSIDECKSAADYFISNAKNLADSLTEICKPKEKGLNVLNHGDFWLGNMLFKHDELCQPIDVKFLDFQVVRYASPALDLLYFLWSSVNSDVRAHRQEDLFRIYLETLNLTLEELGCVERLTKEELNNDLRRSTNFAVLTICNLLPTVLCEPENVITPENMTEENFQDGPNERYQQIYDGKTFSAELPKVMKQFSAWIL